MLRTSLWLFIVTGVWLAGPYVMPEAFGDERPHNVILFVPDGLRSGSVDETTAPALTEIRRRGVDFANSHSVFPTVTTPNSSAMATGHYLGDTGNFGNVIFVPFRAKAAAASETPFLENDGVLDEVDEHFGGSYLGELSVMAAAQAAGYSTAAIGKLGPALIQNVGREQRAGMIIIDDDTGNGGEPLDPEIKAAIKAAGLPSFIPPRSSTSANVDQQKYFVEVVRRVLLPRFKTADKPFFLVFWSRDPDGTQHAQTDSLGKLTPGINGPSSLQAVANADSNIAALRAALAEAGLSETTNIVISADHGFSTISKESKTSASVRRTYNDIFQEIAPGTLPGGFLATDLADGLGQSLFDPDSFRKPVDYKAGGLPRRGNGLIGPDPDAPDVVVAANGGADLIYLPSAKRKELVREVVDLLLKQDYTSGIFVDDDLGDLPGTLPMSTINLVGVAKTPRPSIVVNFRSSSTGCSKPVMCTAEVADTSLLQGQGMHGSFSRADTSNFQAAIGPDFKSGYRDAAPTSNADVGATIAHILHLDLSRNGKLSGRVAREALTDGPASTAFTAHVLRSKPANGLATTLRYQEADGVRYFDAAGFPGRTVGLQ